jgi:hypothetical protein
MRAGRNLLLLISTLVPCNSTSALGQPLGHLTLNFLMTLA